MPFVRLLFVIFQNFLSNAALSLLTEMFVFEINELVLHP